MKELTKNEMKNIKGGAGLSAAVIWIGVSIIISFVVGVISGFTNPEPCGGGD